jgi:hypothetical protein
VEVAVVDARVLRGGAGEEVWPNVVLKVGKDALHQVQQEVREQQPVAVRDSTRHPADVVGCGEVPRLERPRMMASVS